MTEFVINTRGQRGEGDGNGTNASEGPTTAGGGMTMGSSSSPPSFAEMVADLARAITDAASAAAPRPPTPPPPTATAPAVFVPARLSAGKKSATNVSRKAPRGIGGDAGGGPPSVVVGGGGGGGGVGRGAATTMPTPAPPQRKWRGAYGRNVTAPDEEGATAIVRAALGDAPPRCASDRPGGIAHPPSPHPRTSLSLAPARARGTRGEAANAPPSRLANELGFAKAAVSVDGGDGGVRAVAARKKRPNEKAGVVFTSLSARHPNVAVVSKVMPGSIFGKHRATIEGAMVVAVNGTAARDPRHAAELVARAVVGVRLTVRGPRADDGRHAQPGRLGAGADPAGGGAAFGGNGGGIGNGDGPTTGRKKRTRKRRPCSADGCSRHAHVGGLCSAHGAPGPRRYELCGRGGCGRRAEGGGYCPGHQWARICRQHGAEAEIGGEKLPAAGDASWTEPTMKGRAPGTTFQGEGMPPSVANVGHTPKRNATLCRKSRTEKPMAKKRRKNVTVEFTAASEAIAGTGENK